MFLPDMRSLFVAGKIQFFGGKNTFWNIEKKVVSHVFFHCWNALLPSEVWICSLVKAIFLVKPTIFPGQIHIFWVNHSSPHVFDVAKSLLRRCLQSETIQFAQHGVLGDSDGKLDFALVEQFHGNVEIWWAITSKSPANKKILGHHQDSEDIIDKNQHNL